MSAFIRDFDHSRYEFNDSFTYEYYGRHQIRLTSGIIVLT